ncbi:MAG: hypothetical protein Fur0036_09800 [Fimbriimonadaceae bacterium]
MAAQGGDTLPEIRQGGAEALFWPELGGQLASAQLLSIRQGQSGEKEALLTGREGKGMALKVGINAVANPHHQLRHAVDFGMTRVKGRVKVWGKRIHLSFPQGWAHSSVVRRTRKYVRSFGRTASS